MRKTTTQPKKARGELVSMTIKVMPYIKAELEQIAEQADTSLSETTEIILSEYLWNRHKFEGSFKQTVGKVFEEDFHRIEEVVNRSISSNRANISSAFENIIKKVFNREEYN